MGKIEPDFLTANCGNMVALTPISENANKACETIDFEDWQVTGGSIMVDARMAQDLIENLREDGLTVTEE